MRFEEAPLAWIALIPLIGSMLAYLCGRISKDLSAWIATFASAGAFMLVLSLVGALDDQTVFTDVPFTWFRVGALSVDFSFRFDQLTAVMCLVITGIGTLIHLYSIDYMHEDEGRHRFFSYLNLFMFSMLLLVLGGNLLVLFVGWEGVGLCSYLLIGFWFKNISYAAAGRKAFVVNRIGDAGFLIGIFLLYFNFGTVDFVELSSLIGVREIALGSLGLIAFSLFVGATGKSAQIPLFVWLPDAMAGPTPVSALIHAATMVTAGIYMMSRMHVLFSAAPEVLVLVSFVAALTACVAAVIALTQNDIKKVLAYSTVSQLGFMFMAVGAGAYWVALFHVITHALFKACLFLGAGSVIHGCHHEQDMRHMGGLLFKMKWTALTYLISVLAIAGIAPFAGYYSKHAILAALAHSPNHALLPYAHIIEFIATLTAFLTAFYMTRSFAMTFLGEYRGHAHPHESPLKMVLPLVLLAAGATVGGILLEHHLPVYLSPVFGEIAHHEGETFLAALKHSWVGILGVGIALIFYTRAKHVPEMIAKTFAPITVLSQGKFYVDEVYATFIVRPLERIAAALWRIVDQGTIDFLVNMTGKSVDATGFVASRTQTGQLRQYAAMMFVATFFIIVFYILL